MIRLGMCQSKGHESQKECKKVSRLVFFGRLDTEVLAKWFDVKIFNPFCTVWNVSVIQDESTWNKYRKFFDFGR